MNILKLILEIANSILKMVSQKKDPNSIMPLGKTYTKNVLTRFNEVLHYYKLTGIKCAHSDIKRFEDLLNKLGSRFSHDIIRIALPYIKYDKDGLYVTLTWVDRVKLQINFILCLICISSAVLLLTYMNLFLTGKMALIIYVTALFSGCMSYFFLRVSAPLIFARFIYRRLSQLSIM